MIRLGARQTVLDSPPKYMPVLYSDSWAIVEFGTSYRSEAAALRAGAKALRKIADRAEEQAGRRGKP